MHHIPSPPKVQFRPHTKRTETEMERSIEEFAVGCRVLVRTTLGDVFEGQVLTHDKTVDIVVFQDVGQTGPCRNLRFLKSEFIQDATILEKAADPLDMKDTSIDMNALSAREETAIRQAEAEAERIGIGVTQEAQDIFDALAKTLPVRWDNTVIVVIGEVRVSSPYLPENVQGGTPAANERVRKVLEHERKRLPMHG